MQDWMKDPSLSGIDPAKLAMLQSFASQGAGKTQNDILPLLMTAAASQKKKGLQFTQNEIDMIINVMKAGKSQQDIARIDKMAALMKMMQQR